MSHLEVATVALMAAVVVLLSLWDIYARVKQPNGGATISWRLRVLAQRWPIIACAAGVLIGHWWWPNCPKPLECVATSNGDYLVEPRETCNVKLVSTSDHELLMRFSLAK